jgi:uncharacterized protein
VASGHLSHVDEQDCVVLLRSNSVGRVVWNEPGGPMVMPVSYVFTGGNVVFRSSKKGPLAQLNERAISFQVDDYDVETHTGWSVLVRGRCLASDQEPAELPIPWAPEHDEVTVVIEPSVITGRAVSGPDDYRRSAR